MIPSLIELHSEVRRQRPLMPLEVSHAIATLAQAAYEEAEESESPYDLPPDHDIEDVVAVAHDFVDFIAGGV